MTRTELLIFIFLISIPLFAEDHLYKAYNALLQKYVCSGGVDYKGLKSSGPLDAALKKMIISEHQYKTFDKDDQTAYLINVYNGYTLKLIIDNYPLKGIRDINNPWKKEFIPLFGKTVSLDYIEHELLRKKFSEPRIHFALVCASWGCPALQDTVYTGLDLYAQLNRAALNFLNDKKKNRLEKNRFLASEIFKWYGKDFDKKYNGYKNYIKKILKLPDGTRFAYFKYDWSLNEVAKCTKQ